MTGKRVRAAARTALVGVAVVLTAPLWAFTLLHRRVAGGDGAFRGCSELVSLFPGRTGVYLRRGFYRMTLERFAADCQVGFGTTFSHSGVIIHPNVVIGKNCTLGRVELGEGAALGSNVDVLSGRHQHAVGGDVPVQFREGRFERMRIGANAWVGNSAVVMSHVGDGAVIGAGAVVVHAIPPHAVAVGNPAVVKKYLKAEPGKAAA